MVLDLTELLKEAGNGADISAEERLRFPEDELILTRPVKVQLHLINSGASVLLAGALETEVELDCSRCLRKFKFPVKINLTEEYAKGGEIEDSLAEVSKDNSLDLGETIRQNLLLNLPVKPLCKKECQSAGLADKGE